jgi:hypothetical protein
MSPSPSLQCIPADILLQILTHLGPTALLCLRQTSHTLRAFLLSNAATICNIQISTHHVYAAAIFQPSLRDGWLVPTHPIILAEEERLHGTSRYLASIKPDGYGDPGHALARQPVQTGLGLLSNPGPQFLRFLQEYQREILIYASSLDAADMIACYCVRRFLEKLDCLYGETVRCGKLSIQIGVLARTEKALYWYCGRRQRETPRIPPGRRPGTEAGPLLITA